MITSASISTANSSWNFTARWWRRFFGGKNLQWHLRDLKSNVGVGPEAQERAMWERSVHITMVFWHGFAKEIDKQVLNDPHSEGSWLGLWLGVSNLTTIFLLHVAATLATGKARRRVHIILASIVGPIREKMLHN